MRAFLRSLILPEEGLLSLLFLAGVTLSSVWSLQAAGWVEHLDILVWIALIATLWGFLMAKSPSPTVVAHGTGLLLGGAVVAYAVAETLGAASPRTNLLQLWRRFDQWLIVTATGGISTDNLLFLLLLASIVWLISYYGAWSVFRSRGPWWPILSSGSLLVVNLSYARSLDIFALAYLLSAMLLVVRLNVAVQENTWRRNGIQYSSDFAWQLVRSSIIVGVIVVVATWVTPVSTASEQLIDAWSKVSGPWQGVEGQFSRLFGGLQTKEQGVTSSFGKTLALRGSTPLADTPVLAVSDVGPRYLRGIVFDRYTGQGWLAPERSTQQMLPVGSAVPTGNLALRAEITTTVTVLQPRGTTVLAPPQPIRLSIPAIGEYDTFGDGTPGSDVADLSSFRSSVMQRQGQQYTAVASVSIADAASLRAAGTEYPKWVKDRYLPLPRNVPARVLEAARRIGRANDTPFDRAIAVQSYLRGFPYSVNVPGPPAGRDAVDYFLFDARIGYCDYYASAMAVMLRSVGVPARVVSGYSPGQYDSNRRAYVVLDSNAHSWPEVYFPKYGWVEFEPTASRPAPVFPTQPAQVRPAEFPPAATAPDNSDPGSAIPPEQIEKLPVRNEGTAQSSANLIAVLRQVVFTLAAVGASYLILSVLWSRRFRGLAPAEAAYARMITVASWAGVRSLAHLTPFEYGGKLAALVPLGRSDIQLIVEHFVRQRFGHQSPAASDEVGLRQAWHRLRGKLLALTVRRRRRSP